MSLQPIISPQNASAGLTLDILPPTANRKRKSVSLLSPPMIAVACRGGAGPGWVSTPVEDQAFHCPQWGPVRPPCWVSKESQALPRPLRTSRSSVQSPSVHFHIKSLILKKEKPQKPEDEGGAGIQKTFVFCSAGTGFHGKVWSRGVT